MAPKSLEGQTLGKYRILEPLGQGGMAQVYRAYHPTLDRYVAVKVLRSDLIDDQEFLGRFSREARSVAALRHPNIVQVFDYDVENDHYYMVMELLEGNTLKAYLNTFRAQGKTISTGEIAHILTDVLKGLSYAHTNGIIHRDIKPANILLTRRGEAVVTDFGIAQIIGGTQYTVTGALMGTLHYMAPEQGMGQKVDERSDIYSVGVMLYEMLTGHPPFDADTPLAILMKHLNDPLPLPSAPNQAIPKPFERVLLKALAKQPEDRYRNTAEMMQALQKAAEACASIDETAAGLPGVTESAPAGSVPAIEIPQIFSGSERQNITDQQFAAEITDTDLNKSLHPERGTGATSTATLPPTRPSETFNEVAKAAGALFSSVGSVVSAALVSAAEEVKQSTKEVQPAAIASEANPMAEAEPTPERSRRVTQAVILGGGLLVGYNILALMVGTGSGWWGFFQYGWPAELLLIALLLFLLMSALAQIWMLIPAGILAGNGFLLGITAVTGIWRLWGWLWPFEPLLVLGLIVLTINLARRPAESTRRSAKALGTLMSIVTGIVVGLVFIGTIGSGILHAIFR